MQKEAILTFFIEWLWESAIYTQSIQVHAFHVKIIPSLGASTHLTSQCYYWNQYIFN